MKEKALAWLSTILGPTTMKVSLDEIVNGLSVDDIIQVGTPYLTFLGLVFGTLLSFVMLIYWIKKTFKTEKNVSEK